MMNIFERNRHLYDYNKQLKDNFTQKGYNL